MDTLQNEGKVQFKKIMRSLIGVAIVASLLILALIVSLVMQDYQINRLRADCSGLKQTLVIKDSTIVTQKQVIASDSARIELDRHNANDLGQLVATFATQSNTIIQAIKK